MVRGKRAGAAGHEPGGPDAGRDPAARAREEARADEGAAADDAGHRSAAGRRTRPGTRTHQTIFRCTHKSISFEKGLFWMVHRSKICQEIASNFILKEFVTCRPARTAFFLRQVKLNIKNGSLGFLKIRYRSLV